MILLGRPGSERETTFAFRTLVLLFALLVSSVGGAIGAEFTGSWESVYRLDGREFAGEMEGELTVGVVGAVLEAEATVEFDLEEWTELELGASVEASASELSATATFEPDERRFKKLATDLSFEFRGSALDAGFDLYRDHLWADLRVQHELNGVEVDIKTRLGASKTFCLDFYRADVEVSFEARGIPIDIAGRFSAKKDFEWIDVEAILPLPPDLAWLSVEVEARWTRGGMQLSFEPALDTVTAWEGLTASVELFGEAVSSGALGLEGLKIVGVAFDAACGDAWVESRTSFAAGWNKKLTGHKEYAWAGGLGIEMDGPCDREMSVEARFYAAEAAGAFAWDRAAFAWVVRPAGSWELALTTVFAPGSIVGVALGISVDWQPGAVRSRRAVLPRDLARRGETALAPARAPRVHYACCW
jgi:hypothetical protein